MKDDTLHASLAGQSVWIDGNLCVVWRGSVACAMLKFTGGLIIACLFYSNVFPQYFSIGITVVCSKYRTYVYLYT